MNRLDKTGRQEKRFERRGNQGRRHDDSGATGSYIRTRTQDRHGLAQEIQPPTWSCTSEDLSSWPGGTVLYAQKDGNGDPKNGKGHK